MHTIRLQSADLQVFELDAEYARQSGWIRSILEESGNLDEQDFIPLKTINGVVLRKVIEWMVHHKDDLTEDDEEMEDKSDDLFTWDKEFFDVEKEMLIDLVLAANFLDIRGLLEESCRAVADLIGSRSPAEIRQLFNCPDQSSDEQSEPLSPAVGMSELE